MNRRSPPLSPWLDLLAWVPALWLLQGLVSTWLARNGHPYDLEWMEGGMLVHAWRVQQGLPLYVEPGPEFIPYIYPPGYAWVLAGLGSLFGLEHATGRTLSLLGSLAAAAAIVWGVWRHTPRRGWQALSAGGLAAVAFLGCYEDSGAFYDLVRIDGLAMGLAAWAMVLALGEGRREQVAGGLLLAAAFLVKHNAALFGIPLALGLWARYGWRHGLRFGLSAAVPAGLATLLLQWRSGGRFLTYLIEVPALHGIVTQRMWPGTPRELGNALPVASGAAALYVFYSLRRTTLPRAVQLGVPLLAGAALAAYGADIPAVRGITATEAWVDYVAFGGLGLVTASVVLHGVELARTRTLPGPLVQGVLLCGTVLFSAMMMRGHKGGFLNVHIQAHWVLALALGVAVARLRTRSGLAPALLGTALLAGQVVHKLPFLDGRERLHPTTADREAGDALIAQLRGLGLEGRLLSPFNPWFAVQAGLKPSFPLIALWDVEGKSPPFPGVSKAVRKAVADHYYAAAIETRAGSKLGTDKAYGRVIPIGGDARALTTKTGWRVRPAAILLPTPAPPQWTGGDLPAVKGLGRPYDTSKLLSQDDEGTTWRVLEVSQAGVRYSGAPLEGDVAASVGSAELPVLLRAAADERLLRLQPVQVGLARAGVTAFWLELEPARGRDRMVTVPSVPATPPTDRPFLQVAIDGERALVRASELEPVVVAVEDVGALWSEAGEPAVSAVLRQSTEATVQQALEAWVALQSQEALEGTAWDTTWPLEVPAELSSPAEVQAFTAAVRRRMDGG